jgi:uncharacterized lipoprotein
MACAHLFPIGGARPRGDAERSNGSVRDAIKRDPPNTYRGAGQQRCRALAEQIERELMKKNAANFQNLTVLADFQASLERAAEVLERTDGFRQIAWD